MGSRTTAIGTAAALLVGCVAAAVAPAAQAATVDTNAWYVVVNRNSGKALDVAGGSSADGAAITQWARHDGTNQQFQFVDSGGGYYRLKARHSGKLLDVSGWSTADNAAINQWSDHGGVNQQFRLADSPDGYVRLLNRNSGKAVEVPGFSSADGTGVVQFSDLGGVNQQWQLIRVGATGSLPSRFQWSSSGPLAGPKPDAAHPDAASVKDFSIIRYNNQWHVYATTGGQPGWGLVHYAFDDWSQAASAPHTYLDTTAIGPGYRAAPQILYFAPQNLWYLIYQTPWPTYSTSTNPADPRSWSAPRTMMSDEPDIVKQNKGDGGWIDFWVICDSANCHLFFSDDNGHIYRAQTSLGNFPDGFGDTKLILSDTKENLFEATNVYKVDGSNQYLLIQESAGPAWRRYFRTFTSTSLAGPWTPASGLYDDPFAGRVNVTFPGGEWTHDISHGEMVRANNDQTLTINPCRLQFVYQGLDPNAVEDEYHKLPYRMGLLTQTNSPC